jgi:predicted ATPase with chaperone activity
MTFLKPELSVPQQVPTGTQPPVPETVEDTGLGKEFLMDLLLRALYVQGARSGAALAETLRLPFILLDEFLVTLQTRRLLELRGSAGHGRSSYVFDLTNQGRNRARETMQTVAYVGPAPVPLAQYRAWVERQSIRHTVITQTAVREGLSWLVLDPAMLDLLGPAVNSAKSVFLHGESGNGKTAIAETMARMVGGSMFIPYAIEVGGEVLILFDPVHHRAVAKNELESPEPNRSFLRVLSDHDRRYVHVDRPVVMVGGELGMEQLDLQYDVQAKVYQAPFQMKANGGVLILDDFGRQRVPPRDLLNRWIVPLERRVDYLTLHTGVKFPVPFDCLLVFATNIAPDHLVEEAFLRRIHYKIRVDSPTREQYEEIFRRCCAERSLPYTAAATAQIYRDYYERLGIDPRACHPRDILEHLLDIGSYRGLPRKLSPELIDAACRSYFLELTASPPKATVPPGGRA